MDIKLLLQKIGEEGIFCNSLYETSIILPKADKAHTDPREI